MKKQAFHQYTNALIKESSPYLLQHAHNPVHWFAWKEEVLQKAKEEDKPLIISIGYSSCHWCHVMERESYSNKEVAKFMNENFISIKVDREERPDVDQIYMDAALIMNGNGGWPLNAFALPNGQPFFVVTYLPRDGWLSLLKQVVHTYRERRKEVEEQADSLTHHIGKQELFVLPKPLEKEELKATYGQMYEKGMSFVDTEKGGFKGAPKFPMPSAWEWMLQVAHLKGDNGAFQMVELLLEKMAFGGIYDQIGGGFARYATDTRWIVPHFEKMLYDNAQLVSLYAHAFQYAPKPLYERVIRQTLTFVDREWRDESGGFYSSLNADSEGEEGKYYVWKEEEINSVLDQETADLIKEYYQIVPEGNWEQGKNILYRTRGNQAFAEQHDLNIKQWEKIREKAHSALLSTRSKRIPPSTDKKILASWNALMIRAYLAAYAALGDDQFLLRARECGSFIRDTLLQQDGRILRRYMNGGAGINGMLEDYAGVACAFIELYQHTYQKEWLTLADQLVRYGLDHFYNQSSGFFYYTSNAHPSLIARKEQVEDGVIPSSNSLMAHALFSLGSLLDKKEYIRISTEAVLRLRDKMLSTVPYYGNWATLLGKMAYGCFEVAILGDLYEQYNKSIKKHYLPNALFLGGLQENLPLLENKLRPGKTFIYICLNQVCEKPVEGVKEALIQMKR